VLQFYLMVVVRTMHKSRTSAGYGGRKELCSEFSVSGSITRHFQMNRVRSGCGEKSASANQGKMSRKSSSFVRCCC
jgi:hypothetical protein